jgi:gas vesicle protein
MSQIDMKQAAMFLFAGAVAGATIALLKAPQSGVRTRRDIQKFAKKTVSRLDDFQSDIRNQVTDWVDDVSDVIKNSVERGKKVGTESYDLVLQGFDNVKQCVEDGRSRIEQLIKTA